MRLALCFLVQAAAQEFQRVFIGDVLFRLPAQVLPFKKQVDMRPSEHAHLVRVMPPPGDVSMGVVGAEHEIFWRDPLA